MGDKALNQPYKLRTKIRAEINDDPLGTYYTNNQIKFKTSMLKSILCDYSYAYILAKATISIANTVGERSAANNNNKK